MDDAGIRNDSYWNLGIYLEDVDTGAPIDISAMTFLAKMWPKHRDQEAPAFVWRQSANALNEGTVVLVEPLSGKLALRATPTQHAGVGKRAEYVGRLININDPARPVDAAVFELSVGDENDPATRFRVLYSGGGIRASVTVVALPGIQGPPGDITPELEQLRDDVQADADQTALDRIATGQDKAGTAADKAATVTNVAITAANRTQTAQDVITTAAAVVAAEGFRDEAEAFSIAAAENAFLTNLAPDQATARAAVADNAIYVFSELDATGRLYSIYQRKAPNQAADVFRGSWINKTVFDAEVVTRAAADAALDYRVLPLEGIRSFSAGRFGKDRKPAASAVLDANHRVAAHDNAVGTKYRVTRVGREEPRFVPERGFSAGRMDKGRDSLAHTVFVDRDGRQILAIGRGTYLGAPLFLPSVAGTVRVDTFRDPKPFAVTGPTIEVPAVRLRRGSGFIETAAQIAGIADTAHVTGLVENKTFELGIPSVLAYQWIAPATVGITKNAVPLVENTDYRVQYEEGYIVPLTAGATGAVVIGYAADKIRIDAVSWNLTTRVYQITGGTEAMRGANLMPPTIPGGNIEAFRVYRHGTSSEVTATFPYASRINYLRPQEMTDYLREMREWASPHRSIVDRWAAAGAWGRFGSDGDSIDSMQGQGAAVNAGPPALSLNRTPNYMRNRRFYLGALDNADTAALFAASPDNIADVAGKITLFDPGDGAGAATGVFDYLKEGRAWQVLKFLLRTYKGLPTPALPMSSEAAGSWHAIYRNFSIAATNATDSTNGGAGGSWNQTYSGSTLLVRVRATGDVNLASGLTNGTILNGVTLATGNIVFLGLQAAAAQNGLYTVPASGAASRWTGADTAAELAFIAFTLQEGTVGAGETWNLPLAAGSIVVGSTALNFVTGNPNKLATVNAGGLDILMVNGGTNDLPRTDTYANWINKGRSHLNAGIAVLFGLPPRPHANYFFGDALWRTTCDAIEQAARELRIPYVSAPLLFESNKLGVMPLSKHELGETDSQVHCGLQELNAYADIYCKIMAP